MAYTETDLQDIESAIINLGKGRRTVRVTTMGKTIEYGQADLGKLNGLRNEIVAELNAASSGDDTWACLTTSSKGL